MSVWHRHPAVRTGDKLTLGERAADKMRNWMGSWTFIFAALIFLAVWIVTAVLRLAPIDNPQLTILNLVLSCIAALQGGILLIAAKRADQIASEVAVDSHRLVTAAHQMIRCMHKAPETGPCSCDHPDDPPPAPTNRRRPPPPFNPNPNLVTDLERGDNARWVKRLRREAATVHDLSEARRRSTAALARLERVDL